MIITIANQKGGCGKTTTATALSSMLSERGYKTLLIDADQQTNSSDTYRARIEGVATLYDLIVEEDAIDIQEAIQATENGNIIAGDPLLREADTKLSKDLNNRGIKSSSGASWDSGKISRILRNPLYVRANADVYIYYQPLDFLFLYYKYSIKNYDNCKVY